MIKKLKNGFKFIEIKNKVASAKIALQGAHLFEYTCDGAKEILWLSPSSYFENAKAIRGGIPICWPRFGVLDKEMPAHGFTRTAIFELVCINEIDETTTEVTLRLKDTKESREIWDYKFELDIVFVVSDINKEIPITPPSINELGNQNPLKPKPAEIIPIKI